MHRWFFADDEIVIKDPTPSESPPAFYGTPSSLSVADTNWNFKVKCDWKLCSNEFLAVCGSIPVLGKWNPKDCLLLNREMDSSCWSMAVLLPHKHDIYYRYLVCATRKGGQRVVRFWETHEEARFLSRGQILSLDNDNCDVFGFFNDQFKIQRGWISSYITAVQFKFFKSPFVLKTTQSPPLLYVKVSAIEVKQQEKCEKVNSEKHSTADSFKSLEEFENHSKESSSFAFCEVASLQDGNEKFRKQSKYGTPCDSKDILIFHLTLSDFEQTAYLIDLYQFSSKAASDLPAKHFGYQYVSFQDLKGSEGTLHLTMMCATKHRPIGSMRCDYLVVKPIKSHDFKMDKKCQRHWSYKKSGLYIGHRGCGISFRFQNKIIRENTIDSFNLAFSHGADMVEFDVQLTKDGVPIVYHDFQLYLARQPDNIDIKKYDLMKLPIKFSEINSLMRFARKAEDGLIAIPLNKFTKDQLKRIQDYESPKVHIPENPCPESVKNNRPFVTLKTVFKRLNTKLGFLIELKWPQKYTNGSTQEHFIQDIDKNDYVDTILNEVFEKAGSRNIVFSSYDADICTMFQLKQNRYPVLFMVHDAKCSYWDPRGGSLTTGVLFASVMELLGINSSCCDILETPGKVSNTHEHNLCLFLWGSQCRHEDTRKYLKALGVDGVVFDRMNHAIEPADLKRGVYMLDFIEE